MSSYAVIDEVYCSLDWSVKETDAEDTYVLARCRLEESGGELSNNSSYALIKYQPRPYFPVSLHQTGIVITQMNTVLLREEMLEEALSSQVPISEEELRGDGEYGILAITQFRLHTLGQSIAPLQSSRSQFSFGKSVDGYFEYDSEQYAPHQPAPAPAAHAISLQPPSSKVTLPKYDLSD